MNAEELLVMEPDDIDFDSLDVALLCELAQLRGHGGDSRIAMSALSQLRKRAFADESLRQIVLDLATRVINMDGVSDHWYALAFSKIYSLAQSAALSVITRTGRTCSRVALEEFVDLTWPDLQHQFRDPHFWEAATVVAKRLEREKELRPLREEDTDYLEEYWKFLKT